jgi:hypothetical protein
MSTDHATRQQAAEILRLLRILVTGEVIIMTNQERFRAALEANTSAEKSAALLLSSISARLRELEAVNPQIGELADQLEANTAAWAAAVVANTPAASTTPATPAASTTPAAPAAAPPTPDASATPAQAIPSPFGPDATK